jgi:thiol-disulfide isomerase/thioredoxin
MKKFLFAALLFCVVCIPVLHADSILDKPLDLKFTAVDGQQVDLSKMRGKVVLIDFWATWCPPCRAEVPDVVATYRKFHDQGFDVVGVSLDQDKNTMLAFAKEQGMVWPQYFDGQGWDNAVSSSFGVSEIPAMLLIGKDGKIVRPDGSGDLSRQVEKLVKGPAR